MSEPNKAPEQIARDLLDAVDPDRIASSRHLERDNLGLAPFDANGGLGKMWQLFGEDMTGSLTK